ncbi:uncharacterized protein [Venturia canescens]|uniref:uncharacterized protein n=1 Tax=Venturia canescens TaxID=32260 RepID=UPI001C9C65A8|nr:uncharacterized protein LOC122416116 [Venturia canescens]
MFRPTRCFLSTKNGRFISRNKSDATKDNFFDKNIAFESEYYYRQNPQLLKILKQKTEDEVVAMQNKVRDMKAKIDEYNRDINETMRFLKGLENDLSAGSKKKT